MIYNITRVLFPKNVHLKYLLKNDYSASLARRTFTRKTSKNSFSSSTKIIFKQNLLIAGAGIGTTGLSIGFFIESTNTKWHTIFENFRSWLKSSIIIQAECEAYTKKTKSTRHEEDKTDKQGKEMSLNDAFDWYEFFKLLKEEKFYFLAAICVIFFSHLLKTHNFS